MSSPRILLSRILYNTLYYALYLILLGVLIVSPADLMRQAVMHHNNTNILIIAASYLVTILVLAFVYATRLYINRSVLAGIPKGWIPVEKGDGVPRGVREVIFEGLSRSAAIAWGARPRVEGLGGNMGAGREEIHVGGKEKGGGEGGGDTGVVCVGAVAPVWGEIEHPGWASPTSGDLPNLQYEAVISELPNLIEAKALTLAPPDAGSRTDPPMLDPDAVAVLTRPETMGLREYLVHLTEVGVLTHSVVGGFIGAYERARFSTRPVGNREFRGLMHLFAEVLRGMNGLDMAVLEGDGEGEYESDIDEDAPRESSPSFGGEDSGSVRTERGGGGDDNDDDGDDAHGDSNTGDNLNINYNNDDNNNLTRLPTSSTASSLSSSRRHYSSARLGPTGVEGRNTPSMMRNSSANTWQQSQHFRTAPTTPKSRRTMRTRRSSSGTENSNGADSFAQTRHPYVLGSSEEEGDGEGSGSVRSGDSGGSVVVIRLASGEEESVGGLPYVLGRAVTT